MTTEQSDGPLSQPTMPNFHVQNELVEAKEQKAKNAKELESKIDRLEGVIAKFEGMLGNKTSTKEEAYQVERQILSDKMIELVSDLKICQENIRDYQSAIEVLCKNQMFLKKKCNRLTFENKRLKMKIVGMKEVKDQLDVQTKKNNRLVNLIRTLKTETKELFENEIKEQEEYKVFISQTIEENKNLRGLLEGITGHKKLVNFDEMDKTTSISEFEKEYGKRKP